MMLVQICSEEYCVSAAILDLGIFRMIRYDFERQLITLKGHNP